MREQAEFDVIIYGATGFTGRLVAEYMESQYGRTMNWACLLYTSDAADES